MNFDFGEVLSRAWQITWKHKVLWGISLLPFLILFAFVPVWFLIVFQKDFDPAYLSARTQNPLIVGSLLLLYLLLVVVNIFLQALSRSSVTLAIYQAETTVESLAFMDLLKKGLPYFWRILGVSFLVSVGMMAVFLSFFAILALLSVVTFGFAMLCFQPFFILMIPFIWLVMAFMEQSESAIVADGMKLTKALNQAYELIRAHLWKYVLITLILYVGMGALTSLLVFPVMIPMFFFMTRMFEAGMDVNSFIRMQAILGLIFFPLMAVVQSFSITYMKSAMMLVYLRLTRPAQPQLVLQEVVA